MQHKFPESFSNFQNHEMAAVQTKKPCTFFISSLNPHSPKPVVEVPWCAKFSPCAMYILKILKNNLLKQKTENSPAEPNRKNLFLRLIGELRKEKSEAINDVFFHKN